MNSRRDSPMFAIIPETFPGTADVATATTLLHRGVFGEFCRIHGENLVTAPKQAAPEAAQGQPPISFSREFLASIVVFLVALPLCLGIAVASGVPPALGIVSGIIGGLIIAPIAGSPLLVSGPAAGLVVLVVAIVDSYGLVGLGMATLLTGLMQVAGAMLKGGNVFRSTSIPVIKGMLAGIGVIIAASQLHVMIDDDPAAHGIDNILALPDAFLKVTAGTQAHTIAAVVGIASLVVLILWEKFKPSKLKVVPAALLAVIVGAVATAIWGVSGEIVMVSVPDNIANDLTLMGTEALSLLTDGQFLGEAVALAIIASAESLLSAAAVDELHDGVRTKFNKELLAQGVGNSIAGLIGALPITGVIVRSSANVESGAQTRWSAVMHGAWLLLFVVAVPFVLDLIPRTALAAILVYTGYKLLNPPQIVALWKRNRFDGVVFLVTLGTIVMTDLLVGVIVGLLLSAAGLIWRFSKLEVIVRQHHERVDVWIAGTATFVTLPQLSDRLDEISAGKHVSLHLDHLALLDQGSFERIQNWARKYEDRGGTVEIEWDRLNHYTRSDIILSNSQSPEHIRDSGEYRATRNPVTEGT